jgi:PIN like domain
VRFFFDGSLPKRIAIATRILEGPRGASVTFKHEHPELRIDTPDQEWIALLAKERDWAVLSFDPDILRKPHERAAWQEAGLTGFFFDGRWGNVKLEEVAWRFFRRWPYIKATAGAVQEGATYIVPLEPTRRLMPFEALKRKPRTK